MRHHLILSLFAVAVLAGCAAGKPNVTPYERRTNEAVFGDAEIERNYAKEMGRRVELSGPTHIEMASFNGAALLTGEAPQAAMRDQAVRLASIIPGVKAVHDYIRLAKPSSKAARIQDAKLKEALQTSLNQMQLPPGFHPSQIKLVVSQGAVYLMGLVRQSEADAVIAQIRSVAGVKEIVKVFTFIR